MVASGIPSNVSQLKKSKSLGLTEGPHGPMDSYPDDTDRIAYNSYDFFLQVVEVNGTASLRLVKVKYLSVAISITIFGNYW